MNKRKQLELAINKVNESFSPLKDLMGVQLETELQKFKENYEKQILDKIKYSLEELGFIFSDEKSFFKFLISDVKRVVDEVNLTVYYLLGYKSAQDVGEILAESNELKINVAFEENEVYINVG